VKRETKKIVISSSFMREISVLNLNPRDNVNFEIPTQPLRWGTPSTSLRDISE